MADGLMRVKFDASSLTTEELISFIPAKTYNLESFGLMFMIDGNGKSWTLKYYSHFSNKCNDKWKTQIKFT